MYYLSTSQRLVPEESSAIFYPISETMFMKPTVFSETTNALQPTGLLASYYFTADSSIYSEDDTANLLMALSLPP